MSICPECGYRVKVASANKTRKGGDGVWRHKSHKKGKFGILEPGHYSKRDAKQVR